jgi:hypothetical protein
MWFEKARVKGIFNYPGRWLKTKRNAGFQLSVKSLHLTNPKQMLTSLAHDYQALHLANLLDNFLDFTLIRLNSKFFANTV